MDAPKSNLDEDTLDELGSMSPEQKKWWNRFKRTMSAMPSSLELVVTHSNIKVTEYGEHYKTLDKCGHADDVPHYASLRTSFRGSPGPRVFPNSESL